MKLNELSSINEAPSTPNDHKPSLVTVDTKLKKLNKAAKQQKSNKAKENLRTTLMLVIVCVLFLITEFPQSIVLLLSIISKDFYENVYLPLGEFHNII